jgi:arsenate reductase-like glutaredoxin family protein
MTGDNSKRLTKNTLHKFCIEYETYKKSESRPDEDTIRQMLRKHNEKFQDIVVGHGDLLPPKLTHDIHDLSERLTNAINTPTSIDYGYLDLTVESAKRALEIYDNFDDYFK